MSVFRRLRDKSSGQCAASHLSNLWPACAASAVMIKGSVCSMSNAGNQVPNDEHQQASHDGQPQDGPFTPAQMRGLKWLTSIMGILIIICVILLGIGLSRNANKLLEADGPVSVSLPANATIESLTAGADNHIWLYTQSDGVERLQLVSPKGKIVTEMTINRIAP